VKYIANGGGALVSDLKKNAEVQPIVTSIGRVTIVALVCLLVTNPSALTMKICRQNRYEGVTTGTVSVGVVNHSMV